MLWKVSLRLRHVCKDSKDICSATVGNAWFLVFPSEVSKMLANPRNLYAHMYICTTIRVNMRSCIRICSKKFRFGLLLSSRHCFNPSQFSNCFRPLQLPWRKHLLFPLIGGAYFLQRASTNFLTFFMWFRHTHLHVVEPGNLCHFIYSWIALAAKQVIVREQICFSSFCYNH